MAGNIRGITIEIGGDTSSLGKALKQTEADITKVGKELTQVERQLKFEPGNLELLGQKAELSAKQIELTENKLKTLKEAQGQVQAQSEKGDIGAETYRAFQRELIATESKLKKYAQAQGPAAKGAEETAKSTEKAGEAAKEAGGKFSIFGDVLKATLAADAIKAGLNGLVSAIGNVKDAVAGYIGGGAQMASDAAQNHAKLEQVMRNTMEASDNEIESIVRLTEAQQQLGVVSSTVQLGGAQELATYLEKKESLEELIPVMNDMIAQQYGVNASQENAAGIATMLGKVMNGQVGALSRYGYTFDEAQEKILKYGTEAERAAVLAEVVGESVGGMNEALAQTDEGKMVILNNVLADTQQTAGRMANAVKAQILGEMMPAISAVSEAFLNILNGEGSVEDFAATFEGVFEDLTRVMQDVLPELLEMGGQILAGIVEGIANNIDILIEGALALADTLIGKLLDMLPMIIDAGLKILMALADGLIKQLPMLVKAAMDIIVALTIGIAQALPELVPAMIEALMLINQTCYDNLDLLIDAGIELIVGLVAGIVEALPILVDKGPEIVYNMAVSLSRAAIKLVQVGNELLGKVVQGIAGGFRRLAETGKQMLNSILRGIIDNDKSIKDVAMDIVKKLWNGIVSLGKWLKDQFQNFINDVLTGGASAAGAQTAGAQIGEALGESMGTALAGTLRQGNTVQRAGAEAGGAVATGFEQSNAGGRAGASLARGIAGGARAGADEAQKDLEALNKEVAKRHADMTQALEREINAYGDAVTEALRRAKREETDIRKQAVQDQIDLLEDVQRREITASEHVSERKVQLIGDEFIAKARGIDDGLAAFLTASNQEIQRHIDVIALTDQEAAARLQAIQARMAAIDEASQHEREAIEQRQAAERTAELARRIDMAETDEARAKAVEELHRYEESLVQRARERERAEERKRLQEQSREILAQTQQTSEEQMRIIAEIQKSQQGGISSSVEALKTGAFDKDGERQSLQGLEDMYKDFERTARDAAATLVETGREGQEQALKILEKFYPDWQSKGESFVDKLSDGFRDNMAKSVDDAVKVGVETGKGLANGLDSVAPLVNASATRLAELIQQAMADALGIASPSRVAFADGVFVGQGLALGLGAMAPAVERAAQKLGMAARPQAGGGLYGGLPAPRHRESDGGDRERHAPQVNITIENFVNHRAEDVQALMDEMGFVIRSKFAGGWALR